MWDSPHMRVLLTSPPACGNLVLCTRRHPAPSSPAQPADRGNHADLISSQPHAQPRGCRRIPTQPCRFRRPPCHILAVSCQIVATFAAHNSNRQVAASRKPPSIPPPCQIAIRHKIEKRQKRQCSLARSTLPSTIHFACSVTPLRARRGAGGEDFRRPSQAEPTGARAQLASCR